MVLEYPVELGTWLSYKPYHDQEQLDEQKAALIALDLYNGNGQVKFIYTKYLASLNDYLESMVPKIKLKDNTITLEDEIYYSAKIEGATIARSRVSELHNGAKIDKNNSFSEYMVKNAFAATKLMNLYGNSLNAFKLRNVWEVLTNNCCDNEDLKGELFRTGEVCIGQYDAPEAILVPSFMNSWLKFYASTELDEKPFIKAAILHFAFETIHPFCDGNGRMGRMLINNYLIGRGVESTKAVSFSMQIDKTRSKYDVAFIDAENVMNDCTPFITYMLEIMIEAYRACINE